MFEQFTICKACPKFYAVSKEYHKAVYVKDGTWISDFSCVNDFVSNMTTSNMKSVEWMLPTHFKNLRFLDSPTPHLNVASIYEYRIALHQATLATWCNISTMGTIPKVEAVVDLVGTFAPCDGAYINVFQGMGFDFKPNMTRTKVTVDVDLPKVDLVLAQGQYGAIVNFIQQNFCEKDCGALPVIWPYPVAHEVLVSMYVFRNTASYHILHKYIVS